MPKTDFLSAQSPAVRDLTRLIKIESVKSAPLPRAPFGKKIREALDCTFEIARSLGFEPHDADGYAGYADYCPGLTETTGVLAHLDIVPLGSHWTRAQGEISEGNLYGRGATDDKGPLVACLYALKKLKDEGFRPKRTIRLIWGCDEESGSACMDYFAANVGMPEIGFSPDGDFPLISFEKTILHLTATFPLPKGILRWSAGERVNVVPDRSECVTAYNTIGAVKTTEGYLRTDFGRATHAMHPALGDNAVWHTAEALKSLIDPREPIQRLFKLCAPNAVDILGIACADSATGDQTFSIGTIETVGGALNVGMDLRCPLPQDVDGVIAAVQRYFGNATVDYRAPYLYADEQGELYTKLYSVWRAHTGRDDPPYVSGGGTYARHMPCGVAFGPTMPGADYRIHDGDEFIPLSHFNFLIDIYADAMRELSK